MTALPRVDVTGNKIDVNFGDTHPDDLLVRVCRGELTLTEAVAEQKKRDGVK